MAIKELQTRIALKYDSYANWTDEAKGANLVLLKGEIGICEIPSGNNNATTAPTVLFKVGDGTTPFKTLKWASALAADVHGWAKKSEEEFKTWLSETAAFATDAEVDAIRSALDARIEALEDKFNGEDSVDGKIAAAKQEAINAAAADAATKAGTAETNAKAYTDSVVGVKANGEDPATGLRKEIADAEAAAKSYTDGEVDTLEAEDERLADLIDDEVEARKAADKEINDKIGSGFASTEGNTVAEKVAAAATLGQQGIDAAGAVAEDLAELVSGDIADHTAAIEALEDALADEKEAREGVEEDLIDRLEKVEAFFGAAEEHDGYTGLDTALDTLKEIQDYLTGEEGAATGGLIERVAANEDDIADLKAEFDTDGRVTKAEAAIEANDDAIKSLQDIVSGYSGEKAIYNRVEAVSERAEKGITDAKAADDKAVAAQNAAKDIADYVGTADGGLVQDIKATAEDAQSRVEAVEDRMDDAEDAIEALQSIVSSGDNTNAKLREAITALEELTGDDDKGNTALYDEIVRIAGLVDSEDTGLAKTYEIAADAQERVEAIEDDYLKAADAYIFNCGTSTTNIHENTAN